MVFVSLSLGDPRRGNNGKKIKKGGEKSNKIWGKGKDLRGEGNLKPYKGPRRTISIYCCRKIRHSEGYEGVTYDKKSLKHSLQWVMKRKENKRTVPRSARERRKKQV